MPLSVRAQVRDTTPQCVEQLAAATKDTDVIQLAIRVTPFDTSGRLSAFYTQMIAEGVRQFFVSPNPMALAVYDGRLGKRSMPTVQGVYRAYLHADGRLTHPSTLGGTRYDAFDAAAVNAIATLDTAHLLPPVDPAVLKPSDSLDVRIRIRPDTSWHDREPAPPPKAGSVPLAHLRVPLLWVSNPAAPRPHQRAPRYPEDLREAHIEGETSIEFVVQTDGSVNMSSLQILRATHPRFAEAVLDVIASFKFYPLEVGGCPVASIVVMPFTFGLTP